MCLFPRPLRVSLLCKAFNRDNFPKTRAAKKNPCWQLHFMASSTSILSLVFADEAANGAKSEWSSIGPAFVELGALTRTSKAWKIPTHQRIAKAIFFSFDAPSSRTLKLKKAPLHYFRRPCHHLSESGSPLILVGFAVFNRRVMQLASRGETGKGRGRAAAWSISKEVFFFFGIFGKSYARGRRETKKIITVALPRKKKLNSKRNQTSHKNIKTDFAGHVRSQIYALEWRFAISHGLQLLENVRFQHHPLIHAGQASAVLAQSSTTQAFWPFDLL